MSSSSRCQSANEQTQRLLYDNKQHHKSHFQFFFFSKIPEKDCVRSILVTAKMMNSLRSATTTSSRFAGGATKTLLVCMY